MIFLKLIGVIFLLFVFSVWLILCVSIGVCSGMKSYFDVKLESVKEKKKLDEGD